MLTGGAIYLGNGQVAPLPSNPTPGSEYFGEIDGVGDKFRIVLNEQIVTSDSITVNAMHMYLLGPTAIGDLIVGQSHCDVVATSANQAPTADDDVFSIEAGTRLEVSAPGLLANDTDPDGDPLTAQIHATPVSSFPTNGTLSLNADGSFTYLPDFGFSGTDTFTYIARDPRGGNDTATVTITVNPSTAGLQNDNFTDAQVLSGSSGFVTAPDNTDSTIEEGEPPLGVGRSIWYQWTAPVTGAATFDTCGTNYIHALGVYTGEFVDGLLEVASGSFNVECADGSPGTRLTFTASAGTVYHIAVASGHELSTGSTALQWSIVPSPPNDNFADAEVIAGPSGSVNGTTIAATTEENEFLSQDSIWYRWTAPEDGAFAFDTCGSDFDTTLGVYAGESIFPFIEVPFLGGAYPRPDCPSVFFRATGGTVYNVVVGGVCCPPATGDVVLSWAQLPQAPNDDFADAKVISGASGSVTGSNGLDRVATWEPGEPVHANSEPHYSIWYRWTAPADGEVTFGTCDSPIDTVLAVYTGSSVDALTEVASNDDTPECGTAGSRVTFVATSGTTYHVATGSNYLGQVGTVDLAWTQAAPPNHPPTALHDAYGATAGTPLTVGAPGVLTNDTDPDNDALTAGSASDPAGGTVTLNADGSFTYTSDAGFSGTDTFTYTVSDGVGGTDTGTVTITVSQPVIGPPTDANACKNGGWKAFNNPVFRTQGECVASVRARSGRAR
jgi:hypothetical protein